MRLRRSREAAPARLHAVAVVIAGVIGALGGLMTWQGGLMSRIEEDTVAQRFKAQGDTPPTDIVVVGIDDLTLSREGARWPIPRSQHGKALDELRRLGARQVVYDVQFTEQTTEKEDFALFDAVARFPGTILATTETGDDGSTLVLGGDDNLRSVGARAAAANFPTLAGGEIARISHSWGGIPTLATATAEQLGHPVSADDFEAGGAWIAYRGKPGTVPTYSFGDLVEGKLPRRAIAGKIVVVGAVAPTLQDVHPTPTSGDGLMAGPEVQANAIWTVLHGFPLRTAPFWAGLLAVVLLAIGPAIAALWLRALAAAVAPVLAIGYALLSEVVFSQGYVLPVVGPLVGLALGTVGTVSLSYLAERRERRRVSRHNEALEQAVRERTEELRETQLEIVRRLGQAAEWRDEDTGAHIERLSTMCHRLGLAAGMSPTEAELLRHAAVLHDVGKIGVPDRVLLKQGPLDRDEWNVMRNHAAMGASILAGSKSPLIQMAEEVARTHHERWDGTGYPSRLRGEEIPLGGRICAICDVFDALLSRRSYKDPWPLEDALAEVRKLAGTHFDPRLVELFLRIGPDLAAELHGVDVGRRAAQPDLRDAA